MKKKNSLVLFSICFLTINVSLFSCDNNQQNIDDIIAQAQLMDRKDLYRKAIQELNDNTMYILGNSSRMSTAINNFLNYLKGKEPQSSSFVESEKIKEEFPYYNRDFSGKIKFTQPVNNKIFSLISSDIRSSQHTLSMTLIQDGNQIQSKMLDTGYLLNYIPKEWNGVYKENGEPLALQSLNKVFMYNNLGGKTYKNVWDFVNENNDLFFMNIKSEPVGKNFLYMLTNEHYSTLMKEAFDQYYGDDKELIQYEIENLKSDANKLGLDSKYANYSLAFIKRFINQADTRTYDDDTPICNALVKNSSEGDSALIVYSKIRTVTESDESSAKNINIAAYQNDYVGIGGYMYKHYLQILKTSPYPWTSCALINYLTTKFDGFSPWGRNLGGYCSNPDINQDHSKDGYVNNLNTYPCKNDRGYDWWIDQEKGGKLVIEDPQYVANVNYSLGTWIDSL